MIGLILALGLSVGDRQRDGAPSNAVRSYLSTGYVRNASGGYVLRSFT